MRKVITIKGDYLEVNIDGIITNFPTSEIVVSLEDTSAVRYDVLIEHARHSISQKNHGGCPSKCKICKSK